MWRQAYFVRLCGHGSFSKHAVEFDFSQSLQNDAGMRVVVLNFPAVVKLHVKLTIANFAQEIVDVVLWRSRYASSWGFFTPARCSMRNDLPDVVLSCRFCSELQLFFEIVRPIDSLMNEAEPLFPFFIYRYFTGRFLGHSMRRPAAVSFLLTSPLPSFIFPDL